jgi:hypothetical protein
MLRVEVDDSANTLRLKLQGRLVGEEAKNTRSLMTRYRAGMKVVVDLTEVTFADAVGEDLLAFLAGFGADFIAETSYSRYICERLDLHVVWYETSDGITSSSSSANGVQRNRRARRPLVNN